MASNIQSSLQNMQIGAYSNFGDVVTGGWDGVDLDNFPALLATTVGLNLALRFSSKLRKATALCKNSFASQTLIATKDGLVPIEDIKIGDETWAYNENNQTKSLQKVTHLIQGENYKHLVDIKLANGEVITATDNHPFWEVDSRSWLKAEQLSVNALLLNIEEQNISIDALRSYKKDGIVYNLSVANNHTFFVGNTGILGHNCDIDEIMGKLVRKVPKKYCKNGQCVPFSEKLIKLLDEKGIPNKRIEITAIRSNPKKAPNIWSDSFGGNISTNGSHNAVRVGDKIYDNNNLSGVHYNEWYGDLITQFGYKTKEF